MSSFTRNTEYGPITIDFEKYGEYGEPVFLIHGGGMEKKAWHFQIDPFIKAGFTVFAYDVRGFGNSTKPEFQDNEKLGLDFYSYKNDVSDFTALMDFVDVRAGHIVGHSMGGVIAQAVCISYSHRVLSATIANSISFSNALLTSTGKTLEKLKNNDKWCHYNKIKVGMAPETERLLKRVCEIKNPVLLIGGSKDTKSPPACQEYTKSMVPHAEMTIFQGIGHMSIVKAADLFNKTVILFLLKHAMTK
ncbi:alpha/beta fold hydrolase [Thermodesulfobacteriota bacterium]